MKNNRGAFTLMEMLLVTALVSLTGLAVFSAFNNGLKLWARGVSVSHEGNVAIWLDRMGRDLRGTLSLSGIAFRGDATRVSFASTVLMPADNRGSRAAEGVVNQIGAVQYYFDAAGGKMYRRQASYGQALHGQWMPAREVASGLADVKMRYYFADKGFAGRSSANDKVPAGIAVEVRLQGEDDAPDLQRFFTIPAGG